MEKGPFPRIHATKESRQPKAQRNQAAHTHNASKPSTRTQAKQRTRKSKARHDTHLRAFCSSNGHHAVQHPLVIPQLQALLDDIHRRHDRVMKHRRRGARDSRPGGVVPRLVHAETVLREKSRIEIRERWVCSEVKHNGICSEVKHNGSTAKSAKREWHHNRYR